MKRTTVPDASPISLRTAFTCLEFAPVFCACEHCAEGREKAHACFLVFPDVPLTIAVRGLDDRGLARRPVRDETGLFFVLARGPA